MAAGYDDQTNAERISTNRLRWRDDFDYPNLEEFLKNWKPTIVGDGSYVVGDGELTINSGVQAGAGVSVVSEKTFTMPFRLGALSRLSQTIINQGGSIELVSCTNKVPDERNIVSLAFTSASATAMRILIKGYNGGLENFAATSSTKTSTNFFEVEQSVDEVQGYLRTGINSNTSRAPLFTRQSPVPDVDAVYKLRIKMLNEQPIAFTAALANNAGLVRVTSTGHGLTTNDQVRIEGVVGIPNINGSLFPVTVIDANTFDLQGSVFSGAHKITPFISGHFVVRKAPASNTQFILPAVWVEDYTEIMSEMTGMRAAQGQGNSMSVFLTGTNTGSTAPNFQGTAAHDAVAVGNPVQIGGVARTANPTAVAASDATALATTTTGVMITKPYNVPEASWQYAPPAGGIVNSTTAVTIRAAAGTGLRNCITSLDISWDALVNATELAIRDGAAGPVIWRHKLPSGQAGRHAPTLPEPIKGTANTLLEVVTLTATGAAVGVFVNAQGYFAP